MNIECPYCKKEIDKHSKQCAFCEKEIWEVYAVNYFNNRKEAYDGHRGFLIVVIAFTAAVLLGIYYIIREFAAIRRDDPSFCIPYLVAAGTGTLIVCIILWIYFSKKMKQYQMERDSVLNDSIEKCKNCGHYKMKDEECICRTEYIR